MIQNKEYLQVCGIVSDKIRSIKRAKATEANGELGEKVATTPKTNYLHQEG